MSLGTGEPLNVSEWDCDWRDTCLGDGQEWDKFGSRNQKEIGFCLRSSIYWPWDIEPHLSHR